MKKNFKKYFITAIEMREIFVSPLDAKFHSLMTKYEKLKHQNHDKIWVEEAKKLNADFENYVQKLFSKPPFEMDRVPCGIEVYSIEEIQDITVGWHHLSLSGLEFTDVPFDEFIYSELKKGK